MTDKEKQKAWDNYISTGSKDIREQLIIEYAPLVKLVAGRLSMYLNGLVEYEDLTSYGVFGLIDAIDKFSLSKGVKFETYASLRIRGEILDNIRKMDWIPRSVRQHQKKLNEAKLKLRNIYNREPSDDEIISELGITTDEYDKIRMQIDNLSLIYYDDTAGDEDNSSVINVVEQSVYINPEDSALMGDFKEKLAEALELLTDNEKKVILLYYYEDLTLKEISSVLEVSESRISQLHTKALHKLKQSLGDYSTLLNEMR